MADRTPRRDRRSTSSLDLGRGHSRRAVLPPYVLREIKHITLGDVVGAACVFGGGYVLLIIAGVLS